MYYPEELVEEIRERNDIVEVIGTYVKLQKKGSSYFGLCPFHNEKSPSFSVSPDKQMYYCFGCGAGGNVFTFIMEYENYSFPEALKYLADRVGIKLPEREYSEEEKRQQDVMSESVSFFKDGMRKLMKNPLAVGSIIVLIVIIAMILIVPHVVPYKYSQIITVNGSRDKAAGNMAPFTYSEKELAYMAEGGEVFPHIMGTDSMGRDYFIRVIYGTRVSLTVGLFAAVIVLLIGVVYGSISGYFGGKVDMVMMRIVDIIYSLPDMLMVVLLSVVLREVINVDAFPALQKIGTNMISMFIVFALLYWTGMARMVRGQILTVKQNEYILAARVSGAKDSRIIRRHILPNIVSVIIIAAALQIPSAIFTESFLSFIGLGVQAPMPSLGSLANEARAGITQYPYKLLFPAGMICLITLAFNLLGDGLRDAFDPKLRR
mgnify:FL=1